ncbi:MAG: hypothetical protein ACI9BD_001535 [Candidatus Marinamargulisbacteria bacterium]|jgi:hypothetical protein
MIRPSSGNRDRAAQFARGFNLKIDLPAKSDHGFDIGRSERRGSQSVKRLSLHFKSVKGQPGNAVRRLPVLIPKADFDTIPPDSVSSLGGHRVYKIEGRHVLKQEAAYGCGPTCIAMLSLDMGMEPPLRG